MNSPIPINLARIKSSLFTAMKEVSVQAGKAILTHYSKDGQSNVIEKSDGDFISPLTLADMEAHAIIVEGLKKFDIPLLSEEGKNIPYDTRKDWGTYLLVDPLDGTKEFVKGGTDFTVNIAIIVQSIPYMGVVYAPVRGDLYATDGENIYLNDEKIVSESSSQRGTSSMRIVASKSHLTPETKEFVALYPNAAFVSVGSSLKFCLVAVGKADIYPRMGPTMEWDTAAGHALCRAAGKKVFVYDDSTATVSSQELVYNKEDLHNPSFVVRSPLKALITGATGFVGPYLRVELEHAGYDVVGLDRTSGDVHCDITNRDAVFSAIKETMPDVVFHLAGFSSVGKSFAEPQLCMRINVEGTQHLIDALEEYVPQCKLLIISSAEVYGNAQYSPIDEKHPLDPVSPYAKSRVEQEKISLDSALSTYVARSFNHTGKNQPATFVIPSWKAKVVCYPANLEL